MSSATETRRALVIAGLAVAAVLPRTATAQQFDAPFYDEQRRHANAWEAEDRLIDQRLADLQRRFGKRPNIIYILANDVGWGELGWQGGGKHRGTPTPDLDRMAFEGMRFWHAYAEPSSTPTRVALMTGRHAVRTGLLSALWPGQTDGLATDEITIAEVLSAAGYDTAMWGTWQLGEAPEYAPENQGFDYAYYGLYSGAVDLWPASRESIAQRPMAGHYPFYDFPGLEAYEAETGIDLSVAGYIGRKGRPREPIPGDAGAPGELRQDAFEKESIAQIIEYVERKAGGEKPFFIYWATYTQQLAGAPGYQDAKYVDKANAQASFMLQHNKHVGRLLQTLRDRGIAENTFVVWISDNGPTYAFWPDSGYTFLRGAKGDVLEGGIRVPAMAWWPGMIEPLQDPLDFVHVTDLFTTAARLGGALNDLPLDRVIDGIDQTALLLDGEGHSRRNYMFHYSGDRLAAIRYGNTKVVLGGDGGQAALELYNVWRDPGEKFGAFSQGLHVITPVQILLREHLRMIERFPHRRSQTTPRGAEITPHD
jgi:arylsulfatase A-like enzyme